MSTIAPPLNPTLPQQPDAALAAAMTRAASAQSYTTIRLLADRARRADAYRAYAYFRWVDDRIDGDSRPDEVRAFLHRQQSLLDAGYAGRMPTDLGPEEHLLAELIAADDEVDSGLQAYLRHMMGVMAFDAGRRGRLISAAELEEYSRLLATAVMEALLHFIGHGQPAPGGPARYQAVVGAHIIHMLRDAVEDAAAGYINIPAEYLATHRLDPADTSHPAYGQWARERVALARACFADGRATIAALDNPRRRLAGYAYVARFEWVARLIERDGFVLQASYPQRKSAAAVLWMAWRMAGGGRKDEGV